jgi:hypothetical protein
MSEEEKMGEKIAKETQKVVTIVNATNNSS